MDAELGYEDVIEMMRREEQMIVKMGVLEQTIRRYEWMPKETSIQMNNIDSLMKKAIKYK